MTNCVTVTIAEAVTIFSDRLVCPMSELHRVLDEWTRDVLMTHQLPRAATAMSARLLVELPWLAEVEVPEPPKIADADKLDELYTKFVETLAAKYGSSFQVPKAADGEWETRDPLLELLEMLGRRSSKK